MTFGNWEESLHREPKQVGCRERAATVVLQNINSVTGTALADGSGEVPYEVSLESCTCGNFIGTNKPCKHMYRLAVELGLIDNPPKPDREAAKAFKESIPSEIKRFEELYFSGAISSKKYSEIVKALNSK